MSRLTAVFTSFICSASFAFAADNVTAVATPPAPAIALPVVNEPTNKSTNDDLVYRASLGRADDVKLLISKGGNPNSVNSDGVPVLSLAAARKDSETLNVVQALIDGGANINSKDKNGQTALFYAAKNGDAALVKYLLERKINYYLLDNNGDIARTIAFRAGHNDIVTLMDEFVKSQTANIQQNSRAVDAINKQLQPAPMPKAEPTPEEKKALKDALAREEADRRDREKLAAEQAKIERIKKEKEDALRKEKFNTLVYDIAYNACAFQYWSFCKLAPQTTEYSASELIEAIKANKEKSESLSLDLIQTFQANQSFATGIINGAQKQIFDQLNPMPSRTYRRQLGVGNVSDMQERCEAIAKSVDVKMPQTPPPTIKIIEMRPTPSAKTPEDSGTKSD